MGRKHSFGWGEGAIWLVGGAREMKVGTHGQHVHHLPQDTDGLRLGNKTRGQMLMMLMMLITSRCSRISVGAVTSRWRPLQDGPGSAC